MAEIATLSSLPYQLVPAGSTEPAPLGLTEVVREYWVVKVAVNVVGEDGTVMECV